MSKFDDRVVLVKSLPSHYDGSHVVFGKVVKELDVHLNEQRLQEERNEYQLKKVKRENESLEEQLKQKNTEVARLHSQLRQKQDEYSEVKHERDVLETHLLAEIRNSNRLNRDVEGLISTRRTLLEQIDRIQSEHMEDLRRRLEKPRRHHYAVEKHETTD